MLYHLTKVVVVPGAGAGLESKGCQRDVIHLLCPLVGLAVARGCPAVGLLEQFYQTFKGFFVGDDAVHLCGNVCWPICPRGFLAFVGVKLRFCVAAALGFGGYSAGIGRGPEPATPLHDRDSVTGFQHRRRISSILIRNTVVPTAIRTTLRSCLAFEGVKSPKTRSCYEYHPPGRSKTVGTAVGRRDFWGGPMATTPCKAARASKNHP